MRKIGLTPTTYLFTRAFEATASLRGKLVRAGSGYSTVSYGRRRGR